MDMRILVVKNEFAGVSNRKSWQVNRCRLYVCICSLLSVAIVNASIASSSGAEEVYGMRNSENREYDFDFDLLKSIAESGYRGVVGSFVGDPAMYGSRLQQTFYLREGGKFSAKYLIMNLTESNLDYRIFCILDYELQDFSVQRDLVNSYSISILPGKSEMVSFYLPEIKNGAHDFLLLALDKNAEDAPLYPPLYHRANIYVAADYTFPDVEYEKFAGSHTNSKVFRITLSFAEGPNHANQDGDYKSGGVNLSGHIVNNANVRIFSVLMMLSGAMQVDISEVENNQVIYYRAEPHSQVSLKLKAESKLIEEPVILINIENPYRRLESKPGAIGQFPKMVRISNSIDVKEGVMK